jgi:hypothetical protein
MRIISIVLFLLNPLLFAFSKNDVQNGISIKYNKEEKKVFNSDPQAYIEFELKAVKFYVSSFLNLDSFQAGKVLQKKKLFFTELFKDDLDPYTAQKILRKQCLKNVSDKKIVFYSGPQNLWADCRMNQPPKNSSSLSTRLWVICRQTLWEVTARTTDVTVNCLN